MKLSHALVPLGAVTSGVGLLLMDGTVVFAGLGLAGISSVVNVHVTHDPEELPEARAMRKEDEAIEREKALFVKGELTQEEFESNVQGILERRPTDDSYEAKIEARERRRKSKTTDQHVLDDLARSYAIPPHTMGGPWCKECHGMGAVSANEQRRLVGEFVEPHPHGVVRRRQYEETSIHPMDEPYPVEYVIGDKAGKLPAKRLTS